MKTSVQYYTSAVVLLAVTALGYGVKKYSEGDHRPSADANMMRWSHEVQEFRDHPGDVAAIEQKEVHDRLADAVTMIVSHNPHITDDKLQKSKRVIGEQYTVEMKILEQLARQKQVDASADYKALQAKERDLLKAQTIIETTVKTAAPPVMDKAPDTPPKHPYVFPPPKPPGK